MAIWSIQNLIPTLWFDVICVLYTRLDLEQAARTVIRGTFQGNYRDKQGFEVFRRSLELLIVGTWEAQLWVLKTVHSPCPRCRHRTVLANQKSCLWRLSTPVFNFSLPLLPFSSHHLELVPTVSALQGKHFLELTSSWVSALGFASS